MYSLVGTLLHTSERLSSQEWDYLVKNMHFDGHSHISQSYKYLVFQLLREVYNPGVPERSCVSGRAHTAEQRTEPSSSGSRLCAHAGVNSVRTKPFQVTYWLLGGNCQDLLQLLCLISRRWWPWGSGCWGAGFHRLCSSEHFKELHKRASLRNSHPLQFPGVIIRPSFILVFSA